MEQYNKNSLRASLKEKIEKYFWIILLSTAIISIAIGVYTLQSGTATALEVFTLWTVSFAAISIFYLARTFWLSVKEIHISIQQKRVEMAKDFILHLLGHDFQKMITKARTHLEEGIPLNKEEQTQHFGDLNRRSDIITVLNFFEALAVFYNEATIDRKIIQESITHTSLDLYNKAFPFFIEDHQRKSASNYCNWYNMNIDLEKNKDTMRCKIEELEDATIKIRT